MTDKQLLDRLARAVERETPDSLDSILLACREQKGRGNAMTNTTTKDAETVTWSSSQPQAKSRKWIKWTCSIAAVFILACGLYMGLGYYAVDSIISFDVNPSIELQINNAEKVLSATPLNEDAKIVLADMDLKNVDLDVAVNAVIGSMLKNGYVDELKNSILISVENSDTAKGASLQQRLSDEVSSLLDAYSVSGAILSQTVTEDERLIALAAEHNISLGKAALVDLIVSQDERLNFADLAKLSINDLNLLLAGKSDVEGVQSSGQASSGAYIGEEKAKQAAFSHAKVQESAVTSLKVKLDYDDGRMVYDVDFYVGNQEYDYEIDAVDGTVLAYDIERADGSRNTSTSAGGSATTGDSGNYIGIAKAKSIALERAGLTASAVTFGKAELDSDDGQMVYEIEFYHGKIEYECEVHAVTGKILSWDADYDD